MPAVCPSCEAEDRLAPVGPGVERMGEEVAELFPDAEIHAIDVSEACVTYGHHRAEGMGFPVHFKQANAEDTGYEDESFEVPLLLPDEDSPINTRSVALSDLASGVLLGLAAGGVDAQTDLSEDCQEIVEDLTEICHIEAESVAGEDDALIELADYIAVSLKLVHAELKPKHTAKASTH